MLNRTIEDIAQGYTCIGDPKYAKERITRVSFDSRDLDGETLFVPMQGAKVNSHQFIRQVFDETECKVCFASEDPGYAGDRIMITCGNTIEALQELAVRERERIRIPVIGVTGSVGKTTTREMVAAALRGGFRVYSTKGNANSQLGLCQTMFQFDESAQIGVLEMGISIPGEMHRLAMIARPECAVFTNIGISHMENLGSRQGILEEKMHITDEMPAGGKVLINDENDLLHEAVFREDLQVMRYGFRPTCDIYATDLHTEGIYPAFTAHVEGESVPVSLQVAGKHQVLNALAALGAAHVYGVPLSRAAESLGEFTGFAQRQAIRNVQGILVIDDSYNAAPDSMRAALDLLADWKLPGRKIAVLGDMYELGGDAERLHREVGEYARSLSVDEIITLGDLGKYIDPHNFSDREALKAYLRQTVHPGDGILFKASNSVKLWECIRDLYGE